MTYPGLRLFTAGTYGHTLLHKSLWRQPGTMVPDNRIDTIQKRSEPREVNTFLVLLHDLFRKHILPVLGSSVKPIVFG